MRVPLLAQPLRDLVESAASATGTDDAQLTLALKGLLDTYSTSILPFAWLAPLTGAWRVVHCPHVPPAGEDPALTAAIGGACDSLEGSSGAGEHSSRERDSAPPFPAASAHLTRLRKMLVTLPNDVSVSVDALCAPLRALHWRLLGALAWVALAVLALVWEQPLVRRLGLGDDSVLWAHRTLHTALTDRAAAGVHRGGVHVARSAL